jgi:hypothetical protein
VTYLEKEQEDLLVSIVAAHRNVPSSHRGAFSVIQFGDGSRTATIRHDGFPGRQGKASMSDLQVLHSSGLIQLTLSRPSMGSFIVLPSAIQYHDKVLLDRGTPVTRTEERVLRLLQSDPFQRHFGAAYEKWVQAEELLADAGDAHQLTTIGHLCREAMQEFADILIADVETAPAAKPDKAQTINRVAAFLNSKQGSASEAHLAILKAGLEYWRCLNDLIQRQEHGALKEGAPLVLHDAQSVVLQTAVLLSEIAQLSRYFAGRDH